MAMRDLPSSPGRCQFRWLLDTDIKGWIPGSMVTKGSLAHQLTWWGDALTWIAKQRK